MTPEEKAVIEAARKCELYASTYEGHGELIEALDALERSINGPDWMPATFAELLPGDKVRIGATEASVTRASRGQWHAKGREWFDDAGKVRDHMTPWEHEELRIDLTANPGMHVYPPATACEILADAERAAVLALQAGFPGTSSVVNWSA